MDTLYFCNYNITYSPDTLRYFYSSVFQGYSALFTLAGMFYIYFSQSLSNKLNEISDRIKNSVNNILGPRTGEFRDLMERNPIDYIENNVDVEKSKTEPWATVFSFGLMYRMLQKQSREFKRNMLKLLPLSITMLLFSLFALFFIKFIESNILNYIIIVGGIIILIMSSLYFYFLYMMVKNIVSIFHFQIKDKNEFDNIIKEKYGHILKSMVKGKG